MHPTRSEIYSGTSYMSRDFPYSDFKGVQYDIYVYLSLGIRFKDFEPTIDIIADDTRHCKRSVSTAILALERMGYIKIERGAGRRRNRYKVIKKFVFNDEKTAEAYCGPND